MNLNTYIYCSIYVKYADNSFNNGTAVVLKYTGEESLIANLWF